MNHTNNHISTSDDAELSHTEMSSETENNIRESVVSAPKRGREATQRSFLFDNATKTPRLSNNDSPFKLINLVDKRFESMQELLKTMFHESESRLEKMFETKINDLKREIQSLNQRVTKLETCVNDVENLKGEIQTLKSQLQRQENSQIAADLRINGIPYHREENLLEVFKSICDTLQINTPPVKSIYRMHNQNRGRVYTTDAVIIVKLFSAYEKNFILKTLASFRKANKSNVLLNYIGYDSDAPLYINENLTAHNHKIFRSAIELKKMKKIFASFTIRGLVYIKIEERDKPICIESIEQLNDLFRDENHQSQ